MDSTETVTHVSLCAGYGGIDIGLSRVIPTLRTVGFSEIEAFACANLVAKMEAGALDAAPLWTNLKTFPWEEFRGKVGILSGGFPCQPWSNAGKRIGDEDPRHLFPYILAGIKICRPAAVFLENVEGILSAKLAGDEWADPAGTPVLLHVLRELERAGYACAWGLFSAAEVGAPHQRKRIFILGLEHTASFDGWGLSLGTESAQSVAGDSGPCELVHPGLLGPQVGSLPSAGAIESGSGDGGGQSRWPARPGQPQYAWEPPRVVTHGELLLGKLEALELVNSDSGRLERAEKGRRLGADALCAGDQVPNEGTVEPAVGRTPHGPAHRLDPSVRIDSRVDELRLLGNGVVPAVAAKAFRTLFTNLYGGRIQPAAEGNNLPLAA